MGNALQSVLNEVVSLAGVVLHVAGAVNATASRFLTDFGIMPPYQLYLFLVLMVTLSVVALRSLGGLLGWLVVVVLLVLLLQRVVPGIGAPAAGSSPTAPVVQPLRNAL